ncbi:MAG: hypothetical protein JEZ11_07975 [Desulfobacterales bacterium]|nr:hypothetical protein [Desulfobacterales bacterium]
MGFSIKDELENAAAEDFLPQNLPPKLLAVIGLRVDEFLQQYADIATEGDPATARIKFHPDILDIVTRLYVAVHGDHDVDTGDVRNILTFQEAINRGAINYCMAAFRETVGRDAGIDYEKPELSTILTKPPESYDCHDLLAYMRKTNCQNCAGSGSQGGIMPGMPQ